MFACLAAFAGSTCVTATCAGCGAVGSAIAKISARALYVVLFALTAALAVVLRDYAEPLVHKMSWLSAVGVEPSPAWFGARAVTRVSLGGFLFFGGLALATAGVVDRSDPRDRHVHHGAWTLKFFAWTVCVFLPFLLPEPIVHSYAWLSRLGSGVFLVVQMIILLDFAYLWSEDWVNREHVGWLVGLLVSTLVLYAGSITLVVFLFRWYVPAGVPGGCARNAWLVSSSLVPCALFTAVGFHPSARSGAVLPSAVVTAYCIYLCYGALASEPATYACNPHAGEARTRPAEAVNAAMTLAGLAYSALRAGSSDLFDTGASSNPIGGGSGDTVALVGQDGCDSDEELAAGASAEAFPAGPVSYSYSWFHAMFAAASMYLCMMLAGWGGGESGDEGGGGRGVDQGWGSVWVKMVSVWVTAGLHAWTLVAPAVFPDREFY